LHTSAGALLQEAKGGDADVLRTEAAQRILQNQTLLVTAIARYRLGREDADILIDAHSIIDNGHELIEVPVDIVRALRPDGLVLLDGSPELVFERRQKDLRSRPARTVEELRFQMIFARKACEKYAAELKLPLEVGTVAHDQDLDALIDRLVSRRDCN
jgi:adenylate kinase